MSQPKRILIQIVVVILLLFIIYGVWWWGERRADQRIARQAEEYVSQLRMVREQSEAWATALARSEAEAVFQAFASGIHPAVLAGRRDTLDLAIGALLELPGVAFVHIVLPDGSVVASSDRKLTTTGKVGEEAAWALEVQERSQRPGETPGTLEVASPILGPTGPGAVLWMGYKVNLVKENARPEGLATTP